MRDLCLCSYIVETKSVCATVHVLENRKQEDCVLCALVRKVDMYHSVCVKVVMRGYV